MNRIVYILICLLALWLSFLFGRKSVESKTEIRKTDTLVTEVVKIVIDTQYVDKPIPYKVEVRDTLYIRDTVRPLFLVETKRYGDNNTYDLQVSGIDAQLDWIKTYPKTVYKESIVEHNIYIEPKKWNIFIETEAIIMGKTTFININGGLSYTKNRWTIEGLYGRELLQGNNQIKAKARYNFMRF